MKTQTKLIDNRDTAQKKDDTRKVKRIIKMLKYAETRVRRRYSILQHQNAIGMAIFLGSITGMVSFAAMYIYGIVPAWAAVVANAIFASLLHELEHDLIHEQYFKENKFIEGLMFMGVWIFRGNTPNPYYRRKIHRLHHRESGKMSDIEERLITNGMNWGPKRLLFMIDQNLAGLFIGRQLKKEAPAFDFHEMARASFPFLTLFYTAWHLFLAGLVVSAVNYAAPGTIPVPEAVMPYWAALNTWAVVYLLPNFIRQTSIQLISSNMHYYGDFNGHVLYQTQVLNRWYLAPLHLFCFNFGSTHGMHHFVVNQPFYLRQMIAPYGHAVMKASGVRFNDLGSFRRANRYHETKAVKAAKRGAGAPKGRFQAA